jgi:hypothetical protein
MVENLNTVVLYHGLFILEKGGTSGKLPWCFTAFAPCILGL